MSSRVVPEQNTTEGATAVEWGFKSRMRAVMRSSHMEVFSMALTVYALFARDAMLATEGTYERDVDTTLGYVTFAVAILFTFETALNSWTWKGYFPGIFFWLDVIATISLYSEVPFVEQAIFGGAGTVARAGRAARVGTRVGRILRLVRLLRVLRVLRVFSSLKEKRLRRQTTLRAAQLQNRIRKTIDERKKDTVAREISTVRNATLRAMNRRGSVEASTGAVQAQTNPWARVRGKVERLKNRRESAPRVAGHSTVVRRLNEIDAMKEDFEETTGVGKGDGSDDDSGGLANRVSNMMTVKVVIGVLFMMLVLPLLQVDIDPLVAEVKEVGNALHALNMTAQNSNETRHRLGLGTEQVLALQQLREAQQVLALQQLTNNRSYYVRIGNNTAPLVDMPRRLRPTEVYKVCASDADMPGGVDRQCNNGTVGNTFALLDVSALARGAAVANINVTLFVILMLVAGALSITNDSNRLAREITEPLRELGADMESIAMLDLNPTFLEKRPARQATGIQEMDLLQSSFFRMKSGIGSFSKYAPVSVIKGMLRTGEVASLGVAQQPVSILFSDIAGFTTMCESMHPQKMLALLSEYFQLMSDIIERTDGILAEFIGDAVLALWNCPQPIRLHAQQSVEAALQMHEAVVVAQKRWRSRGYPELAIRIGVHTAEVFVGNIGSAERMKYGVMGDGVNLASRLENLNKRYKTHVLVSGDALSEPSVAASYLTRPVDFVKVRGKRLPTKLHEVMGRLARDDDSSEAERPGRVREAGTRTRGPTSRFYLKDVKDGERGYDGVRRAAKLQAEAFEAYLGRDFKRASALLGEVGSLLRSDRASAVLAERCVEFDANPPPEDWDGTDVLDDKFDEESDEQWRNVKVGLDHNAEYRMKRKLGYSYSARAVLQDDATSL